MKKYPCAFLLLALIATTAHALDFRPLAVITSNDGPPTKRYFFQDQGQRFSYRIDNKMTVRGAIDSIVFEFSDVQEANMRWSKSPVNAILPFDEKNLEVYRSAARVLLPREATDIQLEEEALDAIPINGWTSHQFIFIYKMFGIDRRRAITFLNLHPEEQIVLSVSAKLANYEKVYARGYRVLNSISELPVTGQPGPT